MTTRVLFLVRAIASGCLGYTIGRQRQGIDMP
jgi:hypothetical protein